MANDYFNPNPATASHWAPVDRFFPGEVIKASDVSPLINLSNVAMACVGTGVMIQQSWIGGIQLDAVEMDGDDEIPVMTWRAPVLSNRHVTLRIQILGARVETGGAGEPSASVQIFSTQADAGVSIALPPATGWVEDALEIDYTTDRAAVDRVDEIRLFLRGVAGEWAGRIDQLVISVDAIESPLPAQRIDGGAPMGALFGSADRPLSTPTAELLIAAIEAVRKRPRVGLIWSAVDAAYNAAFPSVMPPSIGVEAAAPFTGDHGVVAHLRAPDDADFIALRPMRTRTPAVEDGTWLSQHERRTTPRPAPGVSGITLVGLGAEVGSVTAPIAMSVWMRELVDGDAESWAEDTL